MSVFLKNNYPTWWRGGYFFMPFIIMTISTATSITICNISYVLMSTTSFWKWKPPGRPATEYIIQHISAFSNYFPAASSACPLRPSLFVYGFLLRLRIILFSHNSSNSSAMRQFVQKSVLQACLHKRFFVQIDI